MSFRRFVEYPRRRKPGLLFTTIVCVCIILALEVYIRNKVKNTIGPTKVVQYGKRVPLFANNSNEVIQGPNNLKNRFGVDDDTVIAFSNFSEEVHGRSRINLGYDIKVLDFIKMEKRDAPLKGIEVPKEKEKPSARPSSTANHTGGEEKENIPAKMQSHASTNQLVTIALAICQSNSENATNDLIGVERQVRQARVSMKSAVYFSKNPIKFIIISNTKTVFPMIQEVVRSWPLAQRKKVTLEFVTSFYPEEYEKLKEMFRPCASQRLFLDQALPNEDAIIYIDTDVVFMRSPADAWRAFESFSDKQLLGVAGPSFMYIQRGYDPVLTQFFEFQGHGFNSGVLLYNLTRIRNSPRVWELQMRVSSKLVFFQDIADQDILNFICNQNPDYCYNLDCKWNFRWPFCANFTDRCPSILESGPYLVHGIGGAFANPRHPKMVVIFEEFDRLNMLEPVDKLIATLQIRLPNATARTGYCSKIPGFNEALLKQLVLQQKERDLPQI